MAGNIEVVTDLIKTLLLGPFESPAGDGLKVMMEALSQKLPGWRMYPNDLHESITVSIFMTALEGSPWSTAYLMSFALGVGVVILFIDALTAYIVRGEGVIGVMNGADGESSIGLVLFVLGSLMVLASTLNKLTRSNALFYSSRLIALWRLYRFETKQAAEAVSKASAHTTGNAGDAPSSESRTSGDGDGTGAEDGVARKRYIAAGKKHVRNIKESVGKALMQKKNRGLDANLDEFAMPVLSVCRWNGDLKAGEKNKESSESSPQSNGEDGQQDWEALGRVPGAKVLSILCLDSHKVSEQVVAGCSDRRLRVWTKAADSSGKKYFTLKKQKSVITCTAAGDPGIVFSGHEDGTICKWVLSEPNNKSGSWICHPISLTSSVTCLIAKDSSKVFAGTSDGNVHAFEAKGEFKDISYTYFRVDSATGAEPSQHNAAKGGAITCMDHDPSIDTLAAGTRKGVVHVWSINHSYTSFKNHTKGITSIIVGNAKVDRNEKDRGIKSKFIVAGGKRETFFYCQKAFDTDSGKGHGWKSHLAARLNGHSGPVFCLAGNDVDDDEHMSKFASGGADKTICVWNIEKLFSEVADTSNKTIEKGEKKVKLGRGSSDVAEEAVTRAERAASEVGAKQDNKADDVSRKTSMREKRGSVPYPSATITYKSVGTETKLRDHRKAVTCLAFEGETLISGSKDKTIRLWDLEEERNSPADGVQSFVLNETKAPVSCLIILPDDTAAGTSHGNSAKFTVASDGERLKLLRRFELWSRHYYDVSNGCFIAERVLGVAYFQLLIFPFDIFLRGWDKAYRPPQLLKWELLTVADRALRIVHKTLSRGGFLGIILFVVAVFIDAVVPSQHVEIEYVGLDESQLWAVAENDLSSLRLLMRMWPVAAYRSGLWTCSVGTHDTKGNRKSAVMIPPLDPFKLESSNRAGGDGPVNVAYGQLVATAAALLTFSPFFSSSMLAVALFELKGGNVDSDTESLSVATRMMHVTGRLAVAGLVLLEGAVLWLIRRLAQAVILLAMGTGLMLLGAFSVSGYAIISLLAKIHGVPVACTIAHVMQSNRLKVTERMVVRDLARMIADRKKIFKRDVQPELTLRGEYRKILSDENEDHAKAYDRLLGDLRADDEGGHTSTDDEKDASSLNEASALGKQDPSAAPIGGQLQATMFKQLVSRFERKIRGEATRLRQNRMSHVYTALTNEQNADVEQGLVPEESVDREIRKRLVGLGAQRQTRLDITMLKQDEAGADNIGLTMHDLPDSLDPIEAVEVEKAPWAMQILEDEKVSSTRLFLAIQLISEDFLYRYAKKLQIEGIVEYRDEMVNGGTLTGGLESYAFRSLWSNPSRGAIKVAEAISKPATLHVPRNLSDALSLATNERPADAKWSRTVALVSLQGRLHWLGCFKNEKSIQSRFQAPKGRTFGEMERSFLTIEDIQDGTLERHEGFSHINWQSFRNRLNVCTLRTALMRFGSPADDDIVLAQETRRITVEKDVASGNEGIGEETEPDDVTSNAAVEGDGSNLGANSADLVTNGPDLDVTHEDVETGDEAALSHVSDRRLPGNKPTSMLRFESDSDVLGIKMILLMPVHDAEPGRDHSVPKPASDKPGEKTERQLERMSVPEDIEDVLTDVQGAGIGRHDRSESTGGTLESMKKTAPKKTNKWGRGPSKDSIKSKAGKQQPGYFAGINGDATVIARSELVHANDLEKLRDELRKVAPDEFSEALLQSMGAEELQTCLANEIDELLDTAKRVLTQSGDYSERIDQAVQQYRSSGQVSRSEKLYAFSRLASYDSESFELIASELMSTNELHYFVAPIMRLVEQEIGVDKDRVAMLRVWPSGIDQIQVSGAKPGESLTGENSHLINLKSTSDAFPGRLWQITSTDKGVTVGGGVDWERSLHDVLLAVAEDDDQATRVDEHGTSKPQEDTDQAQADKGGETEKPYIDFPGGLARDDGMIMLAVPERLESCYGIRIDIVQALMPEKDGPNTVEVLPLEEENDAVGGGAVEGGNVGSGEIEGGAGANMATRASPEEESNAGGLEKHGATEASPDDDDITQTIYAKDLSEALCSAMQQKYANDTHGLLGVSVRNLGAKAIKSLSETVAQVTYSIVIASSNDAKVETWLRTRNGQRELKIGVLMSAAGSQLVGAKDGPMSLPAFHLRQFPRPVESFRARCPGEARCKWQLAFHPTTAPSKSSEVDSSWIVHLGTLNVTDELLAIKTELPIINEGEDGTEPNEGVDGNVLSNHMHAGSLPSMPRRISVRERGGDATDQYTTKAAPAAEGIRLPERPVKRYEVRIWRAPKEARPGAEKELQEQRVTFLKESILKNSGGTTKLGARLAQWEVADQYELNDSEEKVLIGKVGSLVSAGLKYGGENVTSSADRGSKKGKIATRFEKLSRVNANGAPDVATETLLDVQTFWGNRQYALWRGMPKLKVLAGSLGSTIPDERSSAEDYERHARPAVMRASALERSIEERKAVLLRLPEAPSGASSTAAGDFDSSTVHDRADSLATLSGSEDLLMRRMLGPWLAVLTEAWGPGDMRKQSVLLGAIKEHILARTNRASGRDDHGGIATQWVCKVRERRADVNIEAKKAVGGLHNSRSDSTALEMAGFASELHRLRSTTDPQGKGWAWRGHRTAWIERVVSFAQQTYPAIDFGSAGKQHGTRESRSDGVVVQVNEILVRAREMLTDRSIRDRGDIVDFCSHDGSQQVLGDSFDKTDATLVGDQPDKQKKARTVSSALKRRRVFVAYSKGHVQEWDCSDSSDRSGGEGGFGKEIRWYTDTEESSLMKIAISPHGDRLYACYAEYMFVSWSTVTGDVVWRKDTKSQVRGEILCMTVLPFSGETSSGYETVTKDHTLLFGSKRGMHEFRRITTTDAEINQQEGVIDPLKEHDDDDFTIETFGRHQVTSIMGDESRVFFCYYSKLSCLLRSGDQVAKMVTPRECKNIGRGYVNRIVLHEGHLYGSSDARPGESAVEMWDVADITEVEKLEKLQPYHAWIRPAKSTADGVGGSTIEFLDMVVTGQQKGDTSLFVLTKDATYAINLTAAKKNAEQDRGTEPSTKFSSKQISLDTLGDSVLAVNDKKRIRAFEPRGGTESFIGMFNALFHILAAAIFIDCVEAMAATDMSAREGLVLDAITMPTIESDHNAAHVPRTSGENQMRSMLNGWGRLLRRTAIVLCCELVEVSKSWMSAPYSKIVEQSRENDLKKAKVATQKAKQEHVQASNRLEAAEKELNSKSQDTKTAAEKKAELAKVEDELCMEAGELLSIDTRKIPENVVTDTSVGEGHDATKRNDDTLNVGDAHAGEEDDDTTPDDGTEAAPTGSEQDQIDQELTVIDDEDDPDHQQQDAILPAKSVPTAVEGTSEQGESDVMRSVVIAQGNLLLVWRPAAKSSKHAPDDGRPMNHETAVVLEGHEKAIVQLDVSRDRSFQALSIDEEGTLLIWNTAEAAALPSPTGTGWNRAVWLPGGTHILVSRKSEGATTRLWNVDKGDWESQGTLGTTTNDLIPALLQFKANTTAVTHICIAREGKCIVYSDGGPKVMRACLVMPAQSDSSGGEADANARLLDSHLVGTHVANSQVTTLSIADDRGCLIVSGSDDFTVVCWEAKSPVKHNAKDKAMRRILGRHRGEVLCVDTGRLRGAGTRIAVSCSVERGDSVRVWNLDEFCMANELVAPCSVTNLSVTATGQVLGACEDMSIRLWTPDVLVGDTAQRKIQPLAVYGAVGVVSDPALQPTTVEAFATMVVSAASFSDMIIHSTNVIGTRRGPVSITISDSVTDMGPSSTPESLISQSSKTEERYRLVTSGHDWGVKVWSNPTARGSEVSRTRGGQLRSLDNAHNASINAVCCADHGCLLLSASNDGRVCVWNATAGKLMTFVDSSTDSRPSSALCVCVVCDVRRLAAAGFADGAVVIFEMDTGKIYQRYVDAHQHELEDGSVRTGVYAVAATSDGRRLVSGGCDSLVKVWQVARGPNSNEIRTLRGHKGAVSSLIVYSDDRHVFSGAENDNGFFVWSLETGQKIKQLGSSRNITALCVDPTTHRLVSASRTRQIELWTKKNIIGSASAPTSSLKYEDKGLVYGACFVGSVHLAVALGSGNVAVLEIKGSDEGSQILKDGSSRQFFAHGGGAAAVASTVQPVRFDRYNSSMNRGTQSGHTSGALEAETQLYEKEEGILKLRRRALAIIADMRWRGAIRAANDSSKLSPKLQIFSAALPMRIITGQGDSSWLQVWDDSTTSESCVNLVRRGRGDESEPTATTALFAVRECALVLCGGSDGQIRAWHVKEQNVADDIVFKHATSIKSISAIYLSHQPSGDTYADRTRMHDRILVVSTDMEGQASMWALQGSTYNIDGSVAKWENTQQQDDVTDGETGGKELFRILKAQDQKGKLGTNASICACAVAGGEAASTDGGNDGQMMIAVASGMTVCVRVPPRGASVTDAGQRRKTSSGTGSASGAAGGSTGRDWIALVHDQEGDASRQSAKRRGSSSIPLNATKEKKRSSVAVEDGDAQQLLWSASGPSHAAQVLAVDVHVGILQVASQTVQVDRTTETTAATESDKPQTQVEGAESTGEGVKLDEAAEPPPLKFRSLWCVSGGADCFAKLWMRGKAESAGGDTGEGDEEPAWTMLRQFEHKTSVTAVYVGAAITSSATKETPDPASATQGTSPPEEQLAGTADLQLAEVTDVDSHGVMIATGDASGLLHFFDFNRHPTRSTGAAHVHHGGVSSISTLEGGRRLASGGADGIVVVWDLGDHTAIRKIRTLSAGARGQTLALCSFGDDDGSTPGHIEATDESRSQQIDAGSKPLRTTFNANLAWRVTTRSHIDGTTRVWDPVAGKCVKSFMSGDNDGHLGASIDVSPDGRHVVTLDRKNRKAKVRDLEDGRVVVCGGSPHKDVLSTVALGVDVVVTSGKDDKRVCVWSLLQGDLRWFWDAPSGVRSLTLTPDGRHVIVGLDTGNSLVLRASGHETEATGRSTNENATGGSATKDRQGDQANSSGVDDGKNEDVDASLLQTAAEDSTGQNGDAIATNEAPMDDRAEEDEEDPDTLSCRRRHHIVCEYEGPKDSNVNRTLARSFATLDISSATASTSNCVTAYSVGDIHWWHWAEDGLDPVTVIKFEAKSQSSKQQQSDADTSDAAPVTCISATPDWHWFAAGAGARLMVFKMPDSVDGVSAPLEPTKDLADLETPISGCNISGDGRFVVIGCEDGDLRVWDVGHGLIVQKLLGHSGPVCAMRGCGGTTEGLAATRAAERLLLNTAESSADKTTAEKESQVAAATREVSKTKEALAEAERKQREIESKRTGDEGRREYKARLERFMSIALGLGDTGKASNATATVGGVEAQLASTTTKGGQLATKTAAVARESTHRGALVARRVVLGVLLAEVFEHDHFESQKKLKAADAGADSDVAGKDGENSQNNMKSDDQFGGGGIGGGKVAAAAGETMAMTRGSAFQKMIFDTLRKHQQQIIPRLPTYHIGLLSCEAHYSIVLADVAGWFMGLDENRSTTTMPEILRLKLSSWNFFSVITGEETGFESGLPLACIAGILPNIWQKANGSGRSGRWTDVRKEDLTSFLQTITGKKLYGMFQVRDAAGGHFGNTFADVI